MVRHVVMWAFKETCYAAQIEELRKEIKAGLEGLKGQIPGILQINVITNPLPSSNVDLMLDATFEDEAALNAYSVHPLHAEVAKNCIDPFRATRNCLDYDI